MRHDLRLRQTSWGVGLGAGRMTASAAQRAEETWVSAAGPSLGGAKGSMHSSGRKDLVEVTRGEGRRGALGRGKGVLREGFGFGLVTLTLGTLFNLVEHELPLYLVTVAVPTSGGCLGDPEAFMYLAHNSCSIQAGYWKWHL